MPVTPPISYPGVYIQEVASGVRTIVGVPTSITAFLGRAPRGAESLQGFEDDYYSPWASEWDVCVWSRSAGRNAAAQAAEVSA